MLVLNRVYGSQRRRLGCVCRWRRLVIEVVLEGQLGVYSVANVRKRWITKGSCHVRLTASWQELQH